MTNTFHILHQDTSQRHLLTSDLFVKKNSHFLSSSPLPSPCLLKLQSQHPASAHLDYQRKISLPGAPVSLVKQLVTWRKAWTRRLVLTAPSNEPWSPYQILTGPPRWFHKPPHTSTPQVNMRILCETQVLLLCGISCSTSGPQVTVSKGSHQQPGSKTCYRVEYFSMFTFLHWKSTGLKC